MANPALHRITMTDNMSPRKKDILYIISIINSF
jgi:hypothetical protein